MQSCSYLRKKKAVHSLDNTYLVAKRSWNDRDDLTVIYMQCMYLNLDLDLALQIPRIVSMEVFSW